MNKGHIQAERAEAIARAMNTGTEQPSVDRPNRERAIITYTLPTWAADYLINGDASWLSDEDIARVDAFCEREGADVDLLTLSMGEDEFFSWFSDLDNRRHGATCIEFTARAK